MLRPVTHTALDLRGGGSRRILAFAAAGVIEIALIGMLVSGMGAKIVKQLPQELSLVDLTLPTPVPPDVTPVPVPEMVKPSPVTVPAPEIRIQRTPAHTITAVVTPHPVVTLAPQPIVVAAPAPAPVVGPTDVETVAGTHTTPPYPELARRLSEQGQVQLHIVIAADGSVTDVAVTQSSGSERLDEAARAWVLANWKYRAATVAGSPVASSTDALVVFDLKNAR